MRLALASCKKLPEPDVDEPLLLDALAKLGVNARVLAWDDPEAPFHEHDLIVLRSTWNYHAHLDAFLAWLDRAGAQTTLLNPPDVVRTNAVKTYLRDLDARGVPAVPTEIATLGETLPLAERVRSRGWDDFIVKPVVSAGSYGTRRFSSDQLDEAARFVDAVARERGAMVQPYMRSVDGYGERSIVWIDGEITHAIRKSPRLSGADESVSGEMPIADDERELAQRALAPYADRLLYARVDVVRDDDGTLRVMELELIEPSLFLLQCPRALDRFAASLKARAAQASRAG